MVKRKDIDAEKIYDLTSRGYSIQDASKELGVHHITLSRRMAEIRRKQGLLLKYRELQSLQLTDLQARILENITPEKIEMAPLRDLIVCFKILKDKELTVDGKPSEIRGLVHYLIEMEKQEAALESVDQIEAEAEEAEVVSAEEEEEEDDLPRL